MILRSLPCPLQTSGATFLRIDALLDIVNSHSVLGRIRAAEERSDVVARSSTAG
jgi:hypothetical protein